MQSGTPRLELKAQSFVCILQQRWKQKPGEKKSPAQSHAEHPGGPAAPGPPTTFTSLTPHCDLRPHHPGLLNILQCLGISLAVRHSKVLGLSQDPRGIWL